MLNARGYTQSANRNRLPTEVWIFLAIVAIVSNALVGWGLHRDRGAGRLLVILPLVSALAFLLIADIDTPRHGIIQVEPQNLISLEQSVPPN